MMKLKKSDLDMDENSQEDIADQYHDPIRPVHKIQCNHNSAFTVGRSNLKKSWTDLRLAIILQPEKTFKSQKAGNFQ